MTTLQRRSKKKQQRGLPPKALRRLVEFKGMGRLPFREYRDDIRELYDGPRGGAGRRKPRFPARTLDRARLRAASST